MSLIATTLRETLLIASTPRHRPGRSSHPRTIIRMALLRSCADVGRIHVGPRGTGGKAAAKECPIPPLQLSPAELFFTFLRPSRLSGQGRFARRRVSPCWAGFRSPTRGGGCGPYRPVESRSFEHCWPELLLRLVVSDRRVPSGLGRVSIVTCM